MKKLFFFAFIGGVISTSYAQESLFPELKFQEEEVPPTTESEEKSGPVENTETNQEIATENFTMTEESPKPVLTEQTVQSEPQVSEESPEEEGDSEQDDKEEKVYIALDNIQTTVAAVKEVSYCRGSFILFNGFKKRPLQELSVSLKIGNTDKKFDFKNVAPQATSGKNFIIIGEDCAAILKVPPVDIQKCQIKGISKKKCKEKIEFVPIPQDNP